MQTFACKKCGSLDVYIKENGTQTGLYCGDCGVWQKWLGKEEKRLVERYIESRNNTLNTENNSKYFDFAKQLIFECIMELHYETEGLSKEYIAAKLNKALKMLDEIRIE